jgi:hypothetical protein
MALKMSRDSLLSAAARLNATRTYMHLVERLDLEDPNSGAVEETEAVEPKAEQWRPRRVV